MNPDPLVHRVARRHRAALRRHVGSVRVEYSSAGFIEAGTIVRLLEPTYGPVLKLTFRQSSQGVPYTVPFDAVTPTDKLVCGRVIIHTAVAASSIMSWGEVIVDEVEVPF